MELYARCKRCAALFKAKEDDICGIGILRFDFSSDDNADFTSDEPIALCKECMQKLNGWLNDENN